MKHLKYDIIFLSWKSYKHNVIIYGEPPKWNCSVWSRVYKKEIIGKTRFREDLKAYDGKDGRPFAKIRFLCSDY